MFEKQKAVCKRKFNNFKEGVNELKNDTAEYMSDNGGLLIILCGCIATAWFKGIKFGIDATVGTVLDVYKTDMTGDSLADFKLKKPLNFKEWLDYLDHTNNTKGGRKNKNIKKYLKEKGFID